MKPYIKTGSPPRCRREAGAALLAAMLTVTLVATLAASALWQQWRDVEIEASERARVQAGWMLSGALDWSRLILREDLRATTASGSTQIDSLNEPWAVPLQEARLSSFLAMDQNNTDETGVDVFLSGSIVDAQGFFNLRNLISIDGAIDKTSLSMLERLCSGLGLPEQQARVIANGMVAAHRGDMENAPLMPQQLKELAWFGVSIETIQRLMPYAALLPERSPLNLNTAPAAVLAAVLDVSSSVAQKMTTARTHQPFRALSDARKAAGIESLQDESHYSVASSFFLVRGLLRLGRSVVEENSLLKRDRSSVRTIWRERGTVDLAKTPPVSR